MLHPYAWLLLDWVGKYNIAFSIAADGRHLRIEQDRAAYSLNLNLASEGIRREDVIRELDRRVRQSGFLQANMIAWLGRVIDGLLAGSMTLTEMARHLNPLADAIAKRIRELNQGARLSAFQASLLEGPAKTCLSNHYEFKFDPNRYPARWSFEGRYSFARHFYPIPGELDRDDRSEETACAIELDGMSEVKYWVRNLERQAESSFWLPTSTDRFYPDFVAQLVDGRILVVEYKGGHLLSNADSKEKNDIGKVWAAASGGRCVFAMATDAVTAGMAEGAQLRGVVC